ncbi:MAG: pyridoxine 5'-phosphate synthase [Bacteroidales bacterium]|jgi:pyridoxine 5-phosphate synthase|nr:pyridoxine 5'-phosphate synthase [Bacteroidales bacterium]
MTALSVNINKIALIRNSRGGNMPNVLQIALDCEKYGAQGITVHPRPDERHIRYADVPELKQHISSELNVEGYPSDSFLNMVTAVKPAQVTLVPDPPEALTSNTGWDTIKHKDFLQSVTKKLQSANIRVSIFVDPNISFIKNARELGADRIELFTEPYALQFNEDKNSAIQKFAEASKFAHSIGLGINAGHDLNLENLHFFYTNIPFLDEVSIGHALISDALYFGLEHTIKMYRSQLQ